MGHSTFNIQQTLSFKRELSIWSSSVLASCPFWLSMVGTLVGQVNMCSSSQVHIPRAIIPLIQSFWASAVSSINDWQPASSIQYEKACFHWQIRFCLRYIHLNICVKSSVWELKRQRMQYGSAYIVSVPYPKDKVLHTINSITHVFASFYDQAYVEFSCAWIRSFSPVYPLGQGFGGWQ